MTDEQSAPPAPKNEKPPERLFRVWVCAKVRGTRPTLAWRRRGATRGLTCVWRLATVRPMGRTEAKAYAAALRGRYQILAADKIPADRVVDAASVQTVRQQAGKG